jgi:hypothetical protein
VEDRITVKKAGTLGFLAQMLLRSQHEIAFHKKLEQAAADKASEANWHEWHPNVPRPIRGPISPGDIARRERELEDLKQQAAEEATEAAALTANVGAGLQPGGVGVADDRGGAMDRAGEQGGKRQTTETGNGATKSRSKDRHLHEQQQNQPEGRPLRQNTDGGLKPPLQETASLVSAPPPQRKLGEHHFQGILRVNGVRQN